MSLSLGRKMFSQAWWTSEMPLANILTSEVSIFPLCGPKDLSDGVVGYQNVWRYGLQVRGNGDYERTNKRISQ